MENEERQIEVTEPLMSRFRMRGKAKLLGQETVVLYMKNISTKKDIKINRIVHQVIVPRITGFPNEDNYFFISVGREYQGEGDLVAQLNIDDNRQAEVTGFDNNPVLAGEGDEIDRWYTQRVGERNIWDDELILKPQDTLSLSYKGNQAGGIIETRVSFGN